MKKIVVPILICIFAITALIVFYYVALDTGIPQKDNQITGFFVATHGSDSNEGNSQKTGKKRHFRL